MKMDDLEVPLFLETPIFAWSFSVYNWQEWWAILEAEEQRLGGVVSQP